MRTLRFLRTMFVLGLAGLALVKAWRLIAAKFPAAQNRVDKARERLEPALRGAATTLRFASTDVAESVREASQSAGAAADLVADAIADAVKPEPSEVPNTDPTQVTSRTG